MSRYAVEHTNGFRLVYGCDNALGWWYEIWRDGELQEERSAFFEGLSRAEFFELLNRWRVSLAHRNAVAMDLFF